MNSVKSLPLVSVIIPTFNRCTMLPRSIDSVLNQTYRNFECIVVDDASLDETEAVVMEYIEKDNRVIYIKNEKNMHASASRNIGINKSRGDSVAFLDDDDEWSESKLEKQINLFNGLGQDYGLVYCWMDYYNKSGEIIREVHPSFKGYIFRDVLDAQRIGGCPTLIVRKAVINEIGGFDESLLRGNDGDFIRRICRNYKVDLVPEVLVKVHTDHGHPNITSPNRQGIVNSLFSYLDRLDKFAVDLKDYKYERIIIFIRIAIHYYQLNLYGHMVLWMAKGFLISPVQFFELTLKFKQKFIL